MDVMPEVQMVNRYRPDLDDMTLLSDMSSHADDKPSRQPFIPYKIDPNNMLKLDALFEDGYHNQLAASLPNHLLLSKYGFSSDPPAKGQESDSSDEDDNDDEDGGDSDDEDGNKRRQGKDDDSVASSISSASRSTMRTFGASLPNSSRRFEFNLSHSLVDVLPGGDLDSARSNTSQASFGGLKTKGYATDLHAELNGVRPKTTQMSPFGLGKLRRQDSGSSLGNQKPPPVSLLQQFPPAVTTPQLAPMTTTTPSHPTIHSARSVGSHHSGAAAAAAAHQYHTGATPHRMIQQLRQERSSTSHMPARSSLIPANAHDHNNQRVPRISHSAHPLSQSLDTGLTPPREKGLFGDWVLPYRPNKSAAGELAEGSQMVLSSSFFEYEKSPAPVNTDLDAYFSSLDPLALSLKSTVKSVAKAEASGIRTVEDEDGGWVLSSDEDDALYDDIKQGGQWDDGEDDGDDDGDLQKVTNEFIVKKRLRMRAEKLIDHTFVQKLFVKKSNVQESQDLIHRMEQLFELLDPEKSGYVTFEAFTRLILAVAPPRILRADVMNFMQAQTKRNDDLVDYNEFIISGKVLILTKAQRQEALENKSRLKSLPKGAREAFAYRNETASASTMVWLKRQKEYVGQESTYTWKNHLKWYQRRKAQALIWLVRRATRSLKHEVILEEARRFLKVKAKQAKAWSELIEIGRASLRTQSKGALAKRRLMKRAMHARRFMIKLSEAAEYLRGMALTAIKDLDYMDRVLALRRETREKETTTTTTEKMEVDEAKIALAKKTQANYAAFFKMKALRQLAVQFLQAKSTKASHHCLQQDAALDFLRDQVYKAKKLLTLQDKARRELMLRAEAAYAFCLAQDQALLNLLRRGGDALSHMDRQEKALAWLLQRGPDALRFTAGKNKAQLELCKIGQHTLRYMNRREEAHIYLNKRRLKSEAFVIRKQEAIVFLRNCPRNVWKIIDNTNAAQAWLAARAERAKKYVLVRLTAAHHLQHTAAKATATFRRAYIAQQELLQLAMVAKYDYFKTFSHQIPALTRVLKTEKTKNLRHERKQQKIRASWTFEEHLKYEMAEVFQLLTSVYTPPHLIAKSPLRKLEAITAGRDVDDFTDEHRFMGIYAFRRMVNYGRIFQVPQAEVDEFFRNADITASCYLTLEAILPWMRKKASKIKNFRFRVSDIISAEERAYISIFLRMLRDKTFLQTAADYSKYEEMKEAKRKLRQQQIEDEWSDDEEEEDEEDIDEDLLFSDLEKMRNMDVGRLMRYLTRKRELEQQSLTKALSKKSLPSDETTDENPPAGPESAAVEGADGNRPATASATDGGNNSAANGATTEAAPGNESNTTEAKTEP